MKESAAPPHSYTTSTGSASIIGIVAAAVSVGIAEVVAGLGRTLRSPVLDVGDRVIDGTPAAVREFAIDTFGTSNKTVLLFGIAVLLAVFGAVVGIVAVRVSFGLGVLGVVIFGTLGVVAALESGRGPAAMLPSVFGTAFGVASLTVLVHLASRASVIQPDDVPGLERRRLLLGLASGAVLAAVGGVAGRWLGGRFRVPMAQRTGTLPGVDAPLPAIPAGADFRLPGLTPFVTANGAFYKIDTGLEDPQIATDDYRLRITGMVDRTRVLTYQDLLDMPQIEADITLACVSNEVGGDLIGNARWQGVRLVEVLADVGIDPAADQIVGRSIDGFTCGFPTAVGLDGRDAMVAVGMNGERLPVAHGFPARLLVPGLYGYVSATKWLTEIELTTFAAFDHYWERRGWAEQAPIKTQSRIDVPRNSAELAAGPVTIAGVAWAPTRGIAAVEVRIDGGPWQPAELATAVGTTTWRQFQTSVVLPPGRHTIESRATDGTGATQPEVRTRPAPNGADGWHTIEINVA